jgi:hypothetical protein
MSRKLSPEDLGKPSLKVGVF